MAGVSLKKPPRIKSGPISKDRREQILDAALRVSANKGFDRASNKDIAKEAGIKTGLIYHYFQSKGALLKSLLEERSPLYKIRQLYSEMYFNFNAIQGVPDPLTPLGIDAFRLLFRGILQTLGIQGPVESVLSQAGSRLFLDFGDLPGDPTLHKLVTNFLASVEPGERDILLELITNRWRRENMVFQR